MNRRAKFLVQRRITKIPTTFDKKTIIIEYVISTPTGLDNNSIHYRRGQPSRGA